MGIATAQKRVLTGADVRNEVLIRYLPLVRFVARRVASAYGLPVGVETSDLVSHGLIGLADAHDRYDQTRGVKFETFAIPRVRGAIVDALRHNDWVPRNVRTRARRLSDVSTALASNLGRAPTRQEIASSLGVEELDGFERSSTPASVLALDEMIAADARGDGTSIAESLMDPGSDDPGAAIEEAELRDRLTEALTGIDERDRLILTLYYFEGLPLGEISVLLGVTESRVSQLHTRALHALRDRLDDA